MAVEQVGRTSKDFDRLLEHVSEQKSKANTIARRADEVLARNHFAEAFELSMRRRAHR